ncbi:MAG: ATP-binding cassette domain-containing protein, partial [Burkholderiales bacterium]
MTPATDDLVVLRELAFAYGDRQVLHDINLRIPRGKVVAIMGGSGCGKTTILRLIGGQLRASEGEVSVAGEAVASLDRDRLYALRRKIG